MGQNKQNWLAKKYSEQERIKDFHTTQSKASKFGAIFAGTVATTATIATIASFCENKSESGYYWAFLALISAFICSMAYDSHKKDAQAAHKAHKQMRNTQRAYIKDRQKKR